MAVKTSVILAGTQIMIGVLSKLQEDPIISEFFEFFKTPWEHFRIGKAYDVIICDESEIEAPNTTLMIVMHRCKGFSREDGENELRKPILLRSGAISFPIYTGATTIHGGHPIIEVDEDRACVGSRFSNPHQTVLHLGYDFFEEVRYHLTHGQPLEYAGFPTLDIHIDNLRMWILSAGVPLIEIPPIAHGSRFFGCLTHDVDFGGIRNYRFDRTMVGFVYRALGNSAVQYLRGQYSFKMLMRNWVAAAELPLVYLGLRADFWRTFDQYRAIEGDVPSTFFFVPFKGNAGQTLYGQAPSIRAVKYDVESFGEEVRWLMDQGCEIGVHGIDSWIDAKKGREEISKIQAITGGSELGVRMHWLYFAADSVSKLEEAGYVFDSTCGYNERIGYRAGTSQVYRPLGAKNLLELPMHIMDTALFYPDRMNLTFSEGLKAIRSFAETAARRGGTLTLNWHDRSIAPERLWDEVYRCAVDELQANGARFLTARAIVEWFGQRRRILFESEYRSASMIHVRLAGYQASAADTIVLRSYQALRQSPLEAATIATAFPYRDCLLAGHKELHIAY